MQSRSRNPLSCADLWDDKSLYSIQIWPAIAKEVKKKTKAAFLLSQLTFFWPWPSLMQEKQPEESLTHDTLLRRRSVLLDLKYNCQFWSNWLTTHQTPKEFSVKSLHCKLRLSGVYRSDAKLTVGYLILVYTLQFSYYPRKKEIIFLGRRKALFVSLEKEKWCFLTRQSSAKTERISWEWGILSTLKVTFIASGHFLW